MSSEKIEYARHKTHFSDKIVWTLKGCMVERTWKTFGFDSLMHKWSPMPIKIVTKLVPINEIGLFKELNQTLWIHRTAVNPINLLPMEMYFKRIRHVTVKNQTNNVYISLVHGRVFCTDCVHTAPLPMNVEPPFEVPNYLTIETISETPCTPQEVSMLQSQLDDPKCIIKPLIFEQNIDMKGNSTFKQIIRNIKS